jgi:elongation factor Ts
VGVLLEVNCETDFVAKTEDFQRFIKDVAMHVAGAHPVPLYVSDSEIDPIVLDKERQILTAKALESGKKPEIVGKIVDGQIAKWKKDVCLLDQVWVRDPEGKKTIGQLQTDIVAKLGENIRVRRFVRWELGEGLEKKKDDFASEVAKQAGLA